jgi:hypothetical protein
VLAANILHVIIHCAVDGSFMYS